MGELVASGPVWAIAGMNDARKTAYLAAYGMWEALQSERHVAAAAELPAASERARLAGWTEVEFVLAAAGVVHQIMRPNGTPPTAEALDALVDRAEDMDQRAFVALALGLRAVVASIGGDTAALLADTSRAVALLDDEQQPPLDRCTAYVVVAAALNSLRLWELVDDLYTRAAELGPRCDEPVQAAAVATNRVLTRLEWALALIETGDDVAFAQQLDRVVEVVPAALAEQLPVLWRHDVEATADLVWLLGGGDPTTRQESLAAQRQILTDDEDLEVLPLFDAALAWALWRCGHLDLAIAAAEQLAPVPSAVSGARTFPSWVRATVLSSREPSAAAVAQREHATLVTRLLWESRGAVLAAARAQIVVERRHAEHAGLSRAVHTDALTGLQNRRSFDDWLQGGSGEARRTALLLVDLDDFKRVNDTYGHECGDHVLRRIGELMRATIRADDVAMRHGGDEFAVLLSNEHLTINAAWERAHELRNAITTVSWAALAPGLVVTVTVGVAVSADPDDDHGLSTEPVEMYRAADRALYAAKRDQSGIVLAEVGTDRSVADAGPVAVPR